MLNRQPPQHQRIDQTEDRGVRADPERERHQNHGGESRRAGRHAKSVEQVARDFIEKPAVTSGPDVFFDLLDTTELQTRLPDRVFPAHAVAHLFGSGRVDTRLQLVVQPLLDVGAPEDPRQDREESFD